MAEVDFRAIKVPGLDMGGLTAHCLCRGDFKMSDDSIFVEKAINAIKEPIYDMYKENFVAECLDTISWVIVLRDEGKVVAVAGMGTSFGISFHGFWTRFEGVIKSHRRRGVGTLLFRNIVYTAQFMARNDPYAEVNMSDKTTVSIRANIDYGDEAGLKLMASCGFVEKKADSWDDDEDDDDHAHTFIKEMPMLPMPVAAV